MLLSKGRLAYWGKTKEVFAYFSGLGYDCPSDVNPADFYCMIPQYNLVSKFLHSFIVDTVSVDYTTQEVEEESKARVEKLVDSFSEYAKAHPETLLPSGSHSARKSLFRSHTSSNIATSAKVRKPPTNWFTQTYVLVHRTTLCILRDRFLLWGGFLEALFLGLLVGAIFYKGGQDDSLAGLKSRLAMLYPVRSPLTESSFTRKIHSNCYSVLCYSRVLCL